MRSVLPTAAFALLHAPGLFPRTYVQSQIYRTATRDLPSEGRQHLSQSHTASKMTLRTSIALEPSANGSQMPIVGLGTWKAPTGVVSEVVSSAISTGYRCIDCACDYGNEQEVGEGIVAGLASAGINRSDLFVTSKLWNTYHRREHVRPAVERTLSDLNLDFLDLYLIHFPISLKYVPFEERYPPEWVHDPDEPALAKLILDDVPVRETWAAMEELVDTGLVRHIGLSNFPVILLMEVLKTARIRPSVLQVELHPYLQQNALLEFCKREHIAVTAFSPLGARSYASLGMDRGDDVLTDPILTDIAAKNGKSPAQVALRWAVQRGTAVIPKTSHVERLDENMDVFSWELNAEEMERIAAMDRGTRYNNPGEFCVGMGMSIPIYD